MISELNSYIIPLLFMLAWSVSGVILLVYLYLHILKMNASTCKFRKGHILSHVVLLSINFISQIIILISILSYTDMIHSWNTYIVNGGLCIAFLTLAGFNTMFSKHLYLEIRDV